MLFDTDQNIVSFISLVLWLLYNIPSNDGPQVAAYKKLAGGVRFLDVIPRNPAGKVLREELKVFGTKVDEKATA